MLVRPRTPLLLLAVALGGCGDDLPMSPSGSSSSSGEPATTGSSTTAVVDEGTTSASTSETTAESGGDTGFPPPRAECGNGYVEAGEECDDGNAEDEDGCNNACEVPCGLQWFELTLGPTLDSEIEGLAIARDANDQIVLAGRLREITVDMEGTVTEGDDTVLVQSHDPTGAMVWAQVLGTPDGDAIVAGVAVDGVGDVYVAATVDAADGGRAIRVTKLAADDGTSPWVHDFDGPFVGEDEIATGIAVGPDGQPVVTGQVRAGAGDDDVWLRKLDAADGSEVWTQTYTGAGSGGFSTDDGGPLAIGPDGSIYVLARIYEDFQTQRGTLLRFGPDGGPPQWTFVPTIGGADQTFEPVAVSVGADGRPVMGVLRAGGFVDFWVTALDASGQEQWTKSRADFEVADAGSDWLLEGLAHSGEELVVLGRYVNDQRLGGSSWWEAWVTRLDADGMPRCAVLQQAEYEGLLPPSLRGYAVTATSDGSAVVTGEQTSSDELALWLGSFRG
ncbi:DUF4215 domain-containing protein [Paraliomyxa miuraensis]|uniref:DUF4215 domain-containing protein n=1 Tax=Paraliomyxa miuraensis TaxID=376150 RepID=UPI00225A2F23|nr:DUF4215 domain-containing protein [Paraliomyxa miuraensis]MCX4240121.1 hypothetical protein [Paraliomyxa miuraensis]